MNNQMRKSSSVRNSKDKSAKENPPQVPLDDVNKPPEPEPPMKEPVFEANSLAEIEAMRRRYREESEKRNKRNMERAKKKKERDEKGKEEIQTDTKQEKEKKGKEYTNKEEKKDSKRQENSTENSEQEEKSGKSEEKPKPVNKPWWEEAKVNASQHTFIYVGSYFRASS